MELDANEFILSAPTLSRGVQRVIVLDTETTGFQPYDRLISLAAIRFEGERACGYVYRVYDPRKDSHPGAAEVHGWDDWMLRFQDLFADDAAEIREWLGWADRLVMHNADFDMRYVQRELRKAGVAPLEGEAHCTMLQARRTWSGSAKLDDCLSRVGLARKGRTHGAYEDALLTAHLYFHLNGQRIDCPIPAEWPGPTNLRPAPPRPSGELPRRTPKKSGCRTSRALPGSHADGVKSEQQIATVLQYGCEAEEIILAVRRAAKMELLEEARDGLLILRHVADSGGTNVDAQLDILDAFTTHVLERMGRADEPQLIQSVCYEALGFSVSEAEAIAASRRIAGRPNDVQAIGPLVINLVKADGATTEEEARVVRQFIALVREERARQVTD